MSMPKSNKITKQEKMRIVETLEDHHAIFARLWDMAEMEFVDDEAVKTACIVFDSQGRDVAFKINEEFWGTLNDIQKSFVICHECIHVIHLHGMRGHSLTPKPVDWDIVNIAADICTNHTLVEGFGFDRLQVDPDNQFIWVDRVFSDGTTHNHSMEYFYARLLAMDKSKVMAASGKALGGHPQMSDSAGKDSEDALSDMKEAIDDFAEEISSMVNEQQAIIENDKACGDVCGNVVDKMEHHGKSRGLKGGHFTRDAVKQKPKWETLIVKWSEKILEENTTEISIWHRKDRRYHALDSTLNLPYDFEYDDITQGNKGNIMMCIDTSYSCMHYFDRFKKAAASLNAKKFNVMLYVFDVEAKRIQFGDKFKAFGGTDFECLVKEYKYLQSIKKIDAVWVLTDGIASKVTPPDQSKWKILLTPDGRSGSFVGCQDFDLANYE